MNKLKKKRGLGSEEANEPSSIPLPSGLHPIKWNGCSGQ